MKLIEQPTGSQLCGQCCVAMVCSLTLEAAIELVGTDKKTRTHHLRDAIRAMTIDVGGRRIRGMPKEGDALLYWKSEVSPVFHWTLYHNKKHYDPIGFIGRSPPIYLTRCGRLLSHLPVTIPR